ncbi:MAG TPA: DinB family protein [Pirellulales bacterium]|nr:DinB family protein [Pirellulales bacterium]
MAAASIKEIAFGDLERELDVTRKVLERLPEKDFGWKPHEKSMSLGRLAMHVATLPQWMVDTLSKDELDMAKPPEMRTEPKNSADLLQEFDKHAAAVRAALAKIDDAGLQKPWSLKQGENVLHTKSKAMIVRLWCLNHMVHHRAQLCLYLRLLNVPVPAVYFNSADEPEWKFD